MTPYWRSHSFILLVTAAIAAAGGFYGARLTTGAPTTQSAETVEETKPVPVQTASPVRGEMAETASAFGVVQLRPTDAIVLSVPYEAVPKAVRVTTGQTIRAGTVLIELDPSPDTRLQLRQAELALEAADRNVEQSRRRREDQLATNADVTTAEQAQRAAQTQLDFLKSRGAGEGRTIKSDVDAFVTAVAAQAGSVVAAGSPLVVLSPLAGVEVRVGVEPVDASALKPGATVNVRVPGSANAVTGAVLSQSHMINPQTRLCDVFVSLNDPAALRPGAFVEADYVRRTVTGLIIPRSATQLDDDEWCVYVAKGDKAERHVVALGPSDGKDIVVSSSGLTENDAVIVERDGELQDGVAIRAGAPDEDEK